MIGLIDTDTILHWNLRERVQAETGLHAYIRTRTHKRDQIRETRYNRAMVRLMITNHRSE